MRLTGWRWFTVTGILLLPAMVRGGTLIDQDTVDLWGDKSGLVLSYATKRLRIDQKDGRLSTIMDFKKNRITILDHVSKTYVAYPFSTWEKGVSQRMGTPESSQKRQVRAESTGVEKTINGFETKNIKIFLDGSLFQDIWVTQTVDLSEMFDTIKKGLGRLVGSSRTEIEEKEEIYRKISEWGFPILTTEYREIYGKTLTEVTEVKRIETRDLGEDLFGPPKAYRQRAE